MHFAEQVALAKHVLLSAIQANSGRTDFTLGVANIAFYLIIIISWTVTDVYGCDFCGVKDMLRRVSIALVLSFLILGCSGVKLGPRDIQQERGAPPVIADHYGAPVLAVGNNWRIYLHARDEDGDMKYIAAALYQAGVGFYRVNFTKLKEADQAEFAGYLVLPIPRDYSFFDDRFDMRILVRDQKDNRSESITLPLRTGHWSEEQVPGKWEKVANNQLDIIILDLESSSFYNRGGNDARRGN